MKFSFGKKDEIEKSLDISIPAKDIEDVVSSKLKEAQRSAKVKGFRKGKAPLDVISKMYGPEIRQDVIYDAVGKEFYALVEKNDLKPVGRPNLIPEKIKENEDVKFKATFEVYPEIQINSLNRITYKRISSSVEDSDVDKTIESIQKRLGTWETVEKIAEEGDQVKIDFKGTMEGEEFEGNSAENYPVEIGSKSMIEGFEEGLIGMKTGDEKSIDLTFPEDYGKSELAGNPVTFEIKANEVLTSKLPDLNEELFKSVGIEAKSKEDFRKEIKSRLEEDLKNLVKNKTKSNLLDSLEENHEFKIPSAMIESEVNNMRIDMARRMGMEEKDIKEEMFPEETFKEQAQKRVKIGIILNTIIEEKEFKPDGNRVRKLIEERAAMYKEPDQVVNWFYSNDEQLKNIESISLEEQVVDYLLDETNSEEEVLTYEECVTGN